MKSRVLVAIVAVGINAGLAGEPSVVGVFCGSSPCGGAIRQVLRFPTNGEPELIEWKVTLYGDDKSGPSSRYDLQCRYGLTAPNQPGLAKDIKSLERQGACTVSKGTKSNPEAVVYELVGAVSLLKVNADILQVLNPDRSLMIGTGGWSYTLNSVEHAEKPSEPVATASQSAESYKISELATGATVFGVFEGRTPGQGIAQELKLPVHAGGRKAKWRVTLYRNPETLAPTTYKAEGSLFRRHVREGKWSIVRGTANDPKATVYQLTGDESDPALLLLKGDENVLFFLDQNRNSLVGNCEFSYTLNRRSK